MSQLNLNLKPHIHFENAIVIHCVRFGDRIQIVISLFSSKTVPYLPAPEFQKPNRQMIHMLMQYHDPFNLSNIEASFALYAFDLNSAIFYLFFLALCVDVISILTPLPNRNVHNTVCVCCRNVL